jgi:hypothetical protein
MKSAITETTFANVRCFWILFTSNVLPWTTMGRTYACPPGKSTLVSEGTARNE